jgi:hypothetical protein
MRKVALFCVALVAGALGVTAGAFAIQGQQSVTVKVTNNRAGTSAKPRSVGKLTVTTATTVVPGEPAWSATAATVHFDKNLVFSPSKFPTCSQTQIQQDNSKCPTGSKVGSGSALATLFLGGAGSPVNPAPKVTAYNGRAGKLYLLVSAPPLVREVMVGSLKPDTGKYGRKLVIPAIPAALQNGGVPGAKVSLTQFRTSVGGTFRGTPFVALKGCSGGKLNFGGDFKFSDVNGAASTSSATSTTNCRRS